MARTTAKAIQAVFAKALLRLAFVNSSAALAASII